MFSRRFAFVFAGEKEVGEGSTEREKKSKSA